MSVLPFSLVDQYKISHRGSRLTINKLYEVQSSSISQSQNKDYAIMIQQRQERQRQIKMQIEHIQSQVPFVRFHMYIYSPRYPFQL
nr:hypothetical protein Q903MT_gene1872 [Picea sitchensis]